jgi:membrane-associated phospholipid phosphatase
VLRYLVALIWPLGVAVLAGLTYLLIARLDTMDATPMAARRGRRNHKASSAAADVTDAVWESARFGAVAVAGTLIVFGLMCALGLIVVHHGLAIDRPIFDWMTRHQVHVVAALMKRLTKLGDTWTTWGAALAAAACLAVTWRQRKWLPPVVLTAAIVIDHVTTLALRHVFHRLGPPTSPLGTYPSGGCDRVIVFYGLIAYLLWREFSGQRKIAIAIAAAVAALGFNEAYSRVYLSLHWFTDALSGLLYGTLLLVIFITAVQFVVGRPSQRSVRDDERATVAADAPR